MEKNVGHIFDMDDTLLFSPYVTDFVRFDDVGEVVLNPNFLEGTLQNNSHKFFRKFISMILSLFELDIILKKKGDFIILCDQDRFPVPISFIEDINFIILEIEDIIPSKVKERYSFEKSIIKSFLGFVAEKEGRLILEEPKGFYSYQETIGMQANENVVEIYQSVKNKAILTGRDISMYPDITRKLSYMGIDLPKNGLYCFDGRYYKNIKDFKGEIVNMLIEMHSWDVVHVYEDKQNWLSHIEESVKEKNKQVEFFGHYIRDAKCRRLL